MKKVFLLVLLALSLLLSAAAAEITLPADIQQVLYSNWGGWTATSFVNPDNGSTAFVTVSSGSRHDLLCFNWSGGQWNYAWHRREALNQDDYDQVLIDRSYTYYGGQSLGIAFSVRGNNVSTYETVWERNGSTWLLRAVLRIGLDSSIVETYTVRSNGVQYTGPDTNYSSRMISGTVQDDIRYFVFSVFPKSYSSLNSKLSNPPSIPEGELTARNIQFSGGKKWEVYSGPGLYYLRGGNGKALVSTNDWIQVFGRENGFILIQYNIRNGVMRFGYILDNALPDGVYVNNLDFVPIDAWTTTTVSITDDPLGSGAVLYTIGAGQLVDWLSVMGSWAYVEYSGEVMVRGFIPINSLTTGIYNDTGSASTTTNTWTVNNTNYGTDGGDG